MQQRFNYFNIFKFKLKNSFENDPKSRFDINSITRLRPFYRRHKRFNKVNMNLIYLFEYKQQINSDIFIEECRFKESKLTEKTSRK